MPSTLVALRMICAPISLARSAAVVSVEKKGLPVPATKMTTRRFSRWRTARRTTYSSATFLTSMAVSTRVSMPMFSNWLWSAMPFMIVASIPM